MSGTAAAEPVPVTVRVRTPSTVAPVLLPSDAHVERGEDLQRHQERRLAALSENTRASTGASERYTMKSNHSTTSPMALKNMERRAVGGLLFTRNLG